jgi:hypothetical protein
MKPSLKTFARAAIILSLLSSTQQVLAHPRDCSSCSVVDQALGDLEQVKAGMTRAELEKSFVMDGGASFRLRTVYVSRRCSYLKVDVDFDPDPGVDRDFSPKDTITKISQLYAAYPSKD